MSTQNATRSRSNPWLTGLLIAAGLALFAGIVATGQPYPGRLAETYGPALLQLGGVAAVGWLMACAVCWQIAASTRRDQPPS